MTEAERIRNELAGPGGSDKRAGAEIAAQLVLIREELAEIRKVITQVSRHAPER